jgi:hypothetical protein
VHGNGKGRGGFAGERIRNKSKKPIDDRYERPEDVMKRRLFGVERGIEKPSSRAREAGIERCSYSNGTAWFVDYLDGGTGGADLKRQSMVREKEIA